MKKTIYIEGSSDKENGDLRQAFSKLFEKELKGQMPKIIMGNGKVQTCDKFLTSPLESQENRFLLVDSDKYSKHKEDYKKDLVFNEIKNKITNYSNNNVFFMIQESEAWILSQINEICELNSPYNRNDYERINKPSEEILRIYPDYHKVRIFTKLLPKLDTTKLKNDFKEFEELINALKS